MSTRHLAERTVQTIEDHIKANLPAALTALNTDRADDEANCEDVKTFFTYAPASLYRLPAIFTVCQNIDFRKQNGQNFVQPSVDITVSCVTTARKRELTQKKTWRYQAALHELLDNTSLSAAGDKVKITSIVTAATFSQVFTDSDDKTLPRGTWAQEVALTLEVEHYENF